MPDNPSEKARLQEFLAAIRTPCRVELSNASPLMTPAFESEFRSKLLAHHCFIGSPLFQESFDSAFIAGCVAAGFDVEPAPEGARFWDVTVNGSRFSLKSSKAQSLSPRFLHVSKLTEAAWIQDCRTATMREENTKALFTEYCYQVHSIIQLRYFAASAFYELVQIPASMLQQVQDVPRSYFNADGPTIKIPIGKQPPDFTLKLDRSDAKITLSNINKDLCHVLGTWQVNP
jgi:hypothetical protein